MRFVIVTGMSGAGKSTAMKMMEDMGFFCIDNLPIPLLDKLVDFATNFDTQMKNVAIGIDARSGENLDKVQDMLEILKSKDVQYEVLFLDAEDTVLVKRYKETRRSHPLAQGERVDKGIMRERQKMEFLKKEADYIIDTSRLLTRELKTELEKIFVQDEEFNSMYVTILSFGFKYGIPADSDIVMDVRFLPNPYYVEELRPKTGNDVEIQQYVMKYDEAKIFLNKLEDMVTFLIPHYISEGKNQLVISIGCTGGKHRSVTLANELYKRLSQKKNREYGLKIEHRDIGKDALEENGLSDEKGTVRYWYDGFSFGKRKDIYNPWSITKYLDTGEYGTYWADTSGNMLISNLIRRSPAKIKTEMEDLLNGRVICTELDEQVIFEQLGRKRGAIWSLMLASGYLKVDRYEMDNRTGKRQYDLKVTNHETMLMFEQMIEDWFTEEDSAYGNFKDALLAGDLDYMNQFMNQVALQTFSSFDTGGKPSEELEPERFYHGFVLGLIVDLAGKYRITSNRESGFGRYDVVMEPLKENLDAIVMEFKVQNTSKEKSLEETVEHALRQIQEKQYDTELLARGIAKERIRYYGFAFRGKKVLIGN